MSMTGKRQGRGSGGADYLHSAYGGADTRFGGDTDPMATVANLADCMLVFACGLMMSVITFWNVDVSVSKVVQSDKLQQVDSVNELQGEQAVAGSTYDERGVVYEDPATGQLYLLEDANAGSDATTSTEGSQTTASDATTSAQEGSTTEGSGQ